MLQYVRDKVTNDLLIASPSTKRLTPSPPKSLWSNFKTYIAGLLLGCKDLPMNSQPNGLILLSSNSKTNTPFAISKNWQTALTPSSSQ